MTTAALAATFNTPISELHTMDRILVIEHDVLCGRFCGGSSPRRDMRSISSPNVVAGLEILRQKPPSAVILDLQQPGSSGSDVCWKIATLIPSPPLVILSASSDVADKLLLLEMGADDYVTVPFSPRELIARLRALIRRASRRSSE
jgi:DNA-binding response OmpR family regulator